MENMSEVVRAILQEELKPLKKDLQSFKEGQKRIDRVLEEIRMATSRLGAHPKGKLLAISSNGSNVFPSEDKTHTMLRSIDNEAVGWTIKAIHFRSVDYLNLMYR